MATPSRSLRQRLVLALVGLSVGSVILAGLITVVAARPATRSAALSDLRRGLDALAEADRAGDLPRLSVARLRNQLLADQAAVIAALPDGTLAQAGQAVPRAGAAGRLLERFRNRAAQAGATLLTALPRGVTPEDLDPTGLLRGETQSGTRGSIAWVAQPLSPTAEGTLVVVATRRVGFFAVGRLGGILVVAAVVAAAVAAAVSLWLVRRLTRPLEAMERTARAIAGGDLDARVGLPDADDELAAVGAAIDTMAAELGRHRSLERAFLMSISHDLRTPLTSIRGYAEAMAEGAADDEPLMDEAARRRAALIIVAEARRLERLVADLLELARLDAREFSLHPGSVDVAEIARHAAVALEPAAREVGVQIVVAPGGSGVSPGEVGGGSGVSPGEVGGGSGVSPEGGGGPVTAVADPERLAQVVANLVENALKYAATTVEVATRAVPGAVEISVADDGPGIDPSDLPRVFERLYTSRRQPGRKVGTGLGLAIVRELVAAMGGHVSVGPTAGGGTRFVVALAAPPASGGAGSTSWRTTSDGSSWSSPTPSASSSSSSTPPAGGSSPWSSTSTPDPHRPGR